MITAKTVVNNYVDDPWANIKAPHIGLLKTNPTLIILFDDISNRKDAKGTLLSTYGNRKAGTYEAGWDLDQFFPAPKGYTINLTQE